MSPRFDVDKAIVNMPLIHELEGKYGMRSTAYIRPCGPFYGAREIRRYLERIGGNEIALHGEFVTTSQRFGDEFKAAAGEKQLLEYITGRDVSGVCMHGGELEQQSFAEHAGRDRGGAASRTRRCTATATSTRSTFRPA